MKWITAGDIKNWITSNQRHCAQTLPELIRRLIFATATTVEEMEFPSGDSVANSGWDGRLKTPVASSLFPTGSSAWEIGTEASPGKKAEEDYLKRTADPLGFTQKDTSFVFVTPRAWPGRVEWQNKKRAAAVWKDVRVIAADAIEQWLDLAPAVALWLGRQIKNLSDNIRDIEGFWEEWSAATKPKMTTEIVIGGRVSDMERIQQWIAKAPSILEVRGDSPDEPFAFLYGTIANLPENEKIRALSRCVLVENIHQLRSCATTFQNSLIIAAPAECREAAGFAVEKGHYVFLSADSKSIDFRSNLFELSRPRREIIEKNLNKNGLSEVEAQRIARDMGRSIPVLRRHLFLSSAKAPTWAEETSAKVLLPVLFVGSWDERKDGDRQVIELLSGESHDKLIEKLKQFLSTDDAPIRKVGSIWMLKSPLDAWFMLSQHLTEADLKLFEKAILSVLTKTDPKYELSADKRWAAGIYGKSNPYSEWLRTGIVESLVLIAVYGNRSSRISSTQTFADHVVKEVFANAGTWETWASLKDVTPLLAEAAPDNFMEAVEQQIKESPAFFQELMTDEGGLFGDCKHSGLLWALEGMAWSSEYFSRAMNLLFDLAIIDKGGTWNNRAINSLKDIFVPGLPQTYATPEERLAIWDTLTAKDSQTVWKFAQHYFGDGSMSEAHRFRWRDMGGNRRGLEPEDNEIHRKYVAGLIPKLTDLACLKENLISSADEFTRLPLEIRDKLLNTLEAADINSFSREERIRLLQCIREACNWVNSYGDDERKKQIPSLYRVLEKFQPEDTLDRVGWLLSDPWPRLPEGEPKEYDAKDTAINVSREKAAREVLDNASLERIIEYAGTIQYVGVLGHALGKVIRDEEEDTKVLDGMIGRISNTSLLIRGYSLGRVEATGPGWVDQQIKRLKTKGNYSAEACALLYLGLPENVETWSAVNSQGKEAEEAYWKLASGYSRADKSEEAPIAIEKLLDVKRPEVALRIAGDPKLLLPSILLKRLLEEILKLEDKKLKAGVMEEYHLGHVFDQLYKNDDFSMEEMVKLEWPFAALFNDLKRYTSSSTAIHRLLQKDPGFFAQLISFIYRRDDRAPDSEKEKVDDKLLERRARVAREALDSWYLLPGVKSDGSVDEKELTEWVESAREKCAETNHTIGGDLQIGFILAHAPSDPDGVWPHIAVRNLIEKLNSKTIEEHIQIEIYNSRGVTSRGLMDGGKQERDLAQRYKAMSDSVKNKWPRTGVMLKSIAESYENEAKGHDIESDLTDLRWD